MTDWFQTIENALKDSQKDIRNFIINTPRCGVFVGMGQGKTLLTLSALALAAPPGHILVIAPKNIADNTWPDEVAKWNIPIRTKSLHITEPGFYKNGKPKKSRLLKPDERAQAFADVLTDPPTMYFTTLHGVAELVEYFSTYGHTRKTPDFSAWPFGTMILDESQSFKDARTKRYKALKKVAEHTDRVILLTGTPAAESLENLWAQVYLLDRGARLGTSMTKFRKRWFYPTKTIPGIGVTEWAPQPGAEDQIFSAVSDIALHRKNHDLNLPGINPVAHSVSLTPYELEAYKKFKADSMLDVIIANGTDPSQATEDDIISIVNDNAAVLRGRLLQFAAGAIKLDMDPDHPDYAVATEQTSQPTLHVHNHKLDLIESLVTDHLTNRTDDGGVLIAHRFVSERDRILHRLRAQGINAQAFDGSNTMLTAWNNRQIDVLLIHPASAGHGLNLQFGGHTMIWSTLPDSAEHYAQANARLNRPGQDRVVDIHTITTANTVDARIPAALESKNAVQQRLLDALDAEIDIADLQNAVTSH